MLCDGSEGVDRLTGWECWVWWHGALSLEVLTWLEEIYWGDGMVGTVDTHTTHRGHRVMPATSVWWVSCPTWVDTQQGQDGIRAVVDGSIAGHGAGHSASVTTLTGARWHSGTLCGAGTQHVTPLYSGSDNVWLWWKLGHDGEKTWTLWINIMVLINMHTRVVK